MEDDVPELEDFEQQIKTKVKEQLARPVPTANASQLGDYTKVNPRYVEDEAEKERLIQQTKNAAKKIEQTIKPKQQASKPVAVAQKKDTGFGGLKKGFFGGGGGSAKTEKKEEKIQQIKKPEKKVNPLEIKEVQEAMKVNDYLTKTKDEWMTGDFLNTVSSNDKISKLFTNPEFMVAIDMFQKRPKEAMEKYGKNKQFMESFQEFCKLMGMQFQNLAQAEKNTKK